jgi:hypothetical protein
MRTFLGPLRTTAGAPAFGPRHHPARRAAANGDSGVLSVGDDSFGTRTRSPGPRRTPVAPGDCAGPEDGVPHSTISGPGGVPAQGVPAYANTLGYGSDVREPGPAPGPALRQGGDQPGFRLGPHPDAAWAGALFVAVDARS